jgi:hypothetical protein
MSAQEHLENMIRELNFTSDLDVPDMEEDGSFFFNFGDKFDLVIKASNEDDQIAFNAFLVQGMKKRKGLFKKLLKYNFLFSDTYGAAFALAKDSGDISLCRFFHAQDMDAIEFEKQINNFLFAADELNDKLKDWLEQDEPSQPVKQDKSCAVRFLKA